MERTVSMNYPVVRQNKPVLLNTFVQNIIIRLLSLYILYINPFLLPVSMFNVVSFDRGVLITNVFNNTRLVALVVRANCPLHLSCILLA